MTVKSQKSHGFLEGGRTAVAGPKNTAELFYRAGPLPKRNVYFHVPLGSEPAAWFPCPRLPPEDPNRWRRPKLHRPELRRYFAEADDRDFVAANVIVRKRCGRCCRPYVRYDSAAIHKDRSRSKRTAEALTEAAAALGAAVGREMDALHSYTMVPCRKCEPCLRYRRRDWYERTRAEAYYCVSKHAGVKVAGNAATTRHRECGIWMMTFTFAPAAHAKSVDLAMDAAADSNVDYATLTADQQLGWRLKTFYNKVFDRFLDRVEKSVGAFRYMLVCELHEGDHVGGSGLNRGQPHWHMLAFETNPERPLRKDPVTAAWQHDPDGGHFKMKLCSGSPRGDEQVVASDPVWIGRVVNYVCAYLTKSPVARIRSSEKFGHPEKWDRQRFDEVIKRAAERRATLAAAVICVEKPVNISRMGQGLRNTAQSTPVTGVLDVRPVGEEPGEGLAPRKLFLSG